MEFIFFVCDEVLGYLKDKLIYGEKDFDFLEEWTEYAYSAPYSIYRKDAASILYKYIDSNSFYKYNLRIENLKSLPTIITSIICEIGIELIGEISSKLETIWNDEKITIKSKIKEIEKIISESKLIDGRC